MILLAVAVFALAFATLVAIHSMSTSRSAMRMLERQATAQARTTETTLERFAFLVGKNLEPTPQQAKQTRQADLYQAERELMMARVIGDPEQTIDFPSPGEARFREKAIGARYELDELDAEAREFLAPEIIDVAADATV